MDIKTRKTPDSVTRIKQERDLFKRQYLKIQSSYENKIKELSVLKELGNTLRSTNFYDKNALFWEQVDTVRKYTGLENITLMLLNEDVQALEVVAASDFGGPVSVPGMMRVEDVVQGQAVTRKAPLIVNDTRKDPLTAGQKGIRGQSMLCVPIMHKVKAIGVLCLEHIEKGGFDQNQVRFFSLVADQIATSIILSRLYTQMIREENQRFLLSRFFSKTVTDEILGSKGNLRLGGQRKWVSIVFADLHGFTSMSENLDQEEVVRILNAYFSHMTPIIFNNTGTLDKLMGDGMMAIFGAPISHKSDPIRAVKSVIEMSSALTEFNEIHKAEGWPELKISIGVNSGEVVAGYIGSEDHLNYTVIGDAVNVAQRLQTIAGAGEIFISRSLKDEIIDRISEIDGLVDIVPLPARKVKGKEKAIEVFKLETSKTRPVDDDKTASENATEDKNE